MYAKFLKGIPLLHNLSFNFLKKLSLKVNEKVYAPEDIIFLVNRIKFYYFNEK